MHSLAENQPFVDGNKRIAWISGKTFLQIHGYTMDANVQEALDLFMNRVAKGMTILELADWIGRHISALIPDVDAALE